MRGQARDFIRHCHAPEERLAVVLIQREGAAKGKVEQKFYTARQEAYEKVLRYLRFRNARGADVYASANPLKPRVRRRRAGDILEARWLYADIDERGPETLRRIDTDAARGRIPEPTAVIRTSEGRYQALWRIEPCGTARAERSLRALAAHYRTDPAATDCARVLRIPGFRSRKRGEEVVLERLVRAPPARIEDFERALPAPPRAEAQARRAVRGREKGRPGGRPGGPDRTPSGQDWAWTRAQLRRGRPPRSVEAELAARRTDKANPAYYAARTVERAVRSLQRPRSFGPSR